MLLKALKWASIIWTLFILVLLLKPGNDSQHFHFFEGEDKIAHFGLFMIWACLLVSWLELIKISGFKQFILTSIFGITLALSTEFIQSYIPNRTADISDFLADLFGCVVGFLITILTKKELLRINKKFDY